MLKRKESKKERKKNLKRLKNIEKAIDKKEYLCYNIDTIKRAESSERKGCFYYMDILLLFFVLPICAAVALSDEGRRN